MLEQMTIGQLAAAGEGNVGTVHHVSNRFAHYKSMKSLDELDHPLVGEFEIFIPVFHKETPIAFTFLGGFDKDDDLYNKVQFITAITNIVAVAIENKRLVKRQIQQERLTREIELASDMQRTLVPAALPNSEAYELSSIYIPHLEVGGDYFDCIEFDHKLCFCVADISGKGLAAALLMANFQPNLRALVNRYDDLKCIIRDLNQAVLRITNGDTFVTFFYAEFCTDTRILRYINAGHIPPYLATKGEIQYLNKGCTILGIFDQITDIATQFLTHEGSAVFQGEREPWWRTPACAGYGVFGLPSASGPSDAADWTSGRATGRVAFG